MEIISRQEVDIKSFSKEEILDQRELFLLAKQAVLFVDFCETEDLAIIGIEGGTYDGSFTPNIDLIRDYSQYQLMDDWCEFRSHCNRQARIFLAAYSHDESFRFYLTIFSKFDWISYG